MTAPFEDQFRYRDCPLRVWSALPAPTYWSAATRHDRLLAPQEAPAQHHRGFGCAAESASPSVALGSAAAAALARRADSAGASRGKVAVSGRGVAGSYLLAEEMAGKRKLSGPCDLLVTSFQSSPNHATIGVSEGVSFRIFTAYHIDPTGVCCFTKA